MPLTVVGQLSEIQSQFTGIKDEIDKQFDKTILALEDSSWSII